jgi:hypothetical protein
MKKNFTLAVLISAVFILSSLGVDSGTACDCFCSDSCACETECVCTAALCYDCEAIIHRRGISELQTAVTSSFAEAVNLYSCVAVNFDLYGICTANIVDTHIRMNN